MSSPFINVMKVILCLTIFFSTSAAQSIDGSRDNFRETESIENASEKQNSTDTPPAQEQGNPKDGQEELDEVLFNLESQRKRVSEILNRLEKLKSKKKTSKEGLDKKQKSINESLPKPDTVQQPPQKPAPLKSQSATKPRITVLTQKETPEFSNYLIISPNFNFSSDLEYSGLGTLDIDSKNGMGLSFEMGKSIGSFDLGLLLGFDHIRLENLTFEDVHFGGKGKITAYKLALQTAFNIDISNHIYFRLGMGVGLSNRHDHFEVGDLSIELNEDNLSLLANLYPSMGVRLTDSSSLFLGYRFSYIGESDDFSDIAVHGIEVGGRFDF